ncbi:MAG: type III polyketide synthase [Chloroflexi bacterium]|nr:type III polyketide synthase [Chloroflexota bacterium]
MNEPAILGLSTAVPSKCYEQGEILEMLRQYMNSSEKTDAIFANAGVGSRYLVVDDSYYAAERTTQQRNERYMEEAVPLGALAAARCLEQAGVTAQEVSDLIVVSCTGIDTPGLDLHLAGRMGMSPGLHRTCVLGMGCYGAFPGLLRAREAALARPGALALVAAVEICSLHFQPGDMSIENVVSSALFSDGAAAALVGTRPEGAQGGFPRLIDAATFCDYQTFDHMAFHLTDHGFRMSLSAYVPRLLAAKIEEFVDGLLRRNGIERAGVRHWGVHPGSSRILDYVEQRLALQPGALDASRKTLFEYGNMSSATILFVLEQLQRQNHPQPGDLGVLMSFGPGLTMEGALVEW